eukprot:TRINITY_DN38865_c0_g1_i2.p1 TRINITY_DN38865_c0_g1~~TRINITY_DN38865_c0_g1_i2.p1  ORF type:complete len:1895 (+),score=478.18 TRINITY_DN38865_c0_g1_i2:83-5767(+)
MADVEQSSEAVSPPRQHSKSKRASLRRSSLNIGSTQEAPMSPAPPPGVPSGGSRRRSSLTGRRGSNASAIEILNEARNEVAQRRRSSLALGSQEEAPPADESPKQKKTMTVEELREFQTAEVLSGVQIRKPSDRAKAAEQEGEKTTPEMTENAKLFQNTRLFGRVADQALNDLAARGEERLFRTGDVVYKEGDKQGQTWLAIVISGQFLNSISEQHLAATSTEVPHDNLGALPVLSAGSLFGELGGLGVCEARTSTITAEVDAKILVIESHAIWAALKPFPDDGERITAETHHWRAFLASKFSSLCHPEVAYQLRCVATLRKLLPGEAITLGGDGSVEDNSKQPRASAIIEAGSCKVDNEEKVLEASAVVCDAATLGVKGSARIRCAGEDACNVALLNRVDFWKIACNFPKEREAFTRLALERMPPATADISTTPLLVQLEGPASFNRSVAGCVKQRVIPPGVEVLAKTEGDTLSFLQQGKCDVIFQGHKVREVTVGCCLGETDFLGLPSTPSLQVIVTEFVILQELKKKDLETQLSRHHHPRSRWRETFKLKSSRKQDGAVERQVRMLKESSFFGDDGDVPIEFMKSVHKSMQVCVFLPGQKIMTETGPDDTMFLLVDGAADRSEQDKPNWSVGPGAIVGAMGLLCTPTGPREVLTATKLCHVLALHRMPFIDALKKHPQVKRHFEGVARDFMLGQEEVQDESWNIYSMPFFRDMGSRFLYLLDLHLERHVFFSDEIIVKEDTEGEEMYILYSGQMEVKVKGMKVGQLEGGMCFGEMALLGLVKRRSATVVAKTMSDVRILSRDSLSEAIKEHPEELIRFERLAATRNRMSVENRNGGRVKHLCSFFKDCNPEFAKEISDKLQDRLFTKGQVVMSEHAAGDTMMLLTQGTATVSLQSVKVAELKTGDIIGELVTLALARVRTATVTATETCFVQEIQKDALLPILQKFPEELKMMRQLAAQRMEWKYVPESIRSFDVFSGAPPSFIELVDLLTKRWIFFKDDILLHKGAAADNLIMLCTGSVAVEEDGYLIDELGEGCIIGELGALGFVHKRSCTVRCKAALDHVLEIHPSQEANLRRVATKRMRRDVERNSDKNVLLNCPLFRQSSRKFLDRIAAHLEDRLYRVGEDLCTQGEKGDTMFILVQGRVDVIILKAEKEITVSELPEGSVIGEISVLGLSNARTATLRAKKVCLVQILHRSILMKYLAEFPREIIQFQEVGAARLAQHASTNKELYPAQALFKECSREFHEELCQLLKRKIFFPGQNIVAEGQDAHEMFAIAQGRAAVEKNGSYLGELKEGSAFGEMAVLRVSTSQSLTVKAEIICDLQVLNCFDLDILLEKWPEEKARLLKIVAAMMREDLDDFTNEDILQEVPLFSELFSPDVISRLNEVVQVRISRAEELIDPTGIIVVLQGKATVHIGSSITRELFEGDSYGDDRTLGIVEERTTTVSLEVRASSQTVCLYLFIAREDALRALGEQGSAGWQEVAAFKSTFDAPFSGAAARPEKVFEKNQVIAHFQLSEEQRETLLKQRCEERVCVAGQELLSREVQCKTMVFMVAGKATTRVSRNAITLVPGSCLGDLKDPSRSAASRTQPVTALTHCKFFTLAKQSFMEFVKAEPREERERLLAKMEDMPVDESAKGNPSRPTTMEQLCGRLFETCLAEVKTGLQDQTKPWNRQAASGHHQHKGLKRSWTKGGEGKEQRHTSIIADSEDETPKKGRARANSGSGLALLKTAARPESKSATWRRRKEKISEFDVQERLFCSDMRRLALAARATVKDAQKEQSDLRAQAEKLRKELKDRKRGDRRARFGCNLTPAQLVQEQELETWIEAAEKRVAKLTKLVDAAKQKRQDLLAELRSCTEASSEVGGTSPSSARSVMGDAKGSPGPFSSTL